MTTSTFQTSASASGPALRPLLSIVKAFARGLRGTLSDFNRYMDAAHRVAAPITPDAQRRHTP